MTYNEPHTSHLQQIPVLARQPPPLSHVNNKARWQLKSVVWQALRCPGVAPGLVRTARGANPRGASGMLVRALPAKHSGHDYQDT